MTTVDVHLVVVQGGAAVRSWRGRSNCGFLVFSDVLVSADAFPLGLLGVIVPAVVESLGGRGMTAENEDFLVFSGQGRVLRSGGRQSPLLFFKVPSALLCINKMTKSGLVYTPRLGCFKFAF